MQILFLVLAMFITPERIVQAVREYAGRYRMPDVTYNQTITILRRKNGSERWKEVWKNDSQRIAHDGREYLCCRLGKNHKPIPNQWMGTWYVPGSGTFPWDGTKATIVWKGWESVRGRRVAVFDYTVDQQDSRCIAPNFRNKAVIPRSEGGEFSGPVTNLRGSAVVAYAGTLWVDPSTGAIWRQVLRITEMPAGVTIRSSSETTEFDAVQLGETEHLLKISDVSVVQAKTDSDRVEVLFRDYRKFKADSSVTFFDVDSTIAYPRERTPVAP